MAPTDRLMSLATRTPSRHTYVCLQCRRNGSLARQASKPPSTSPCLSRSHGYTLSRYASSTSSTPLLEKVRKRVWGTESPPGQENPYGAPGVVERRRMEKEAQKPDNGQELSLEKEKSVNTMEEVTEDDTEEIEATTWEGMPTVGTPDWGIENWDEEHPYEGYMTNEACETREEMICLIHQAMVEVMTLKQAGLPMILEGSSMNHLGDYIDRIAMGARFDIGADGQTQVMFEEEGIRRMIMDHVVPRPASANGQTEQEEEVIDEESAEDGIVQAESEATGPPKSASIDLETAQTSQPSFPEESPDDVTDEYATPTMPSDDSWRTVTFEDPDFKFAVLKRVMRLTGKRIPDPDIQTIDNAKSLLTCLVKKPKPKKLAEILSTNDLADLPNVQLSERRYTPIDKEKEIGRWKVIEEELEARGLPVTGNGLPARGESIA